jgi:hypothetical protein
LAQKFPKSSATTKQILKMVVAGRKKNAKSDDNFESVEIFQKVRGPNSFVHKTKKRKTT